MKNKVIRVDPNENKKEEIWIQRYTQGECHVEMKAEVREMCLRANEHKRSPANHQGLREVHGTDALPQPLKEPALLTS